MLLLLLLLLLLDRFLIFLSFFKLIWLVQFKRQKTKQQTRNFAKSVVNLVDAVSY